MTERGAPDATTTDNAPRSLLARIAAWARVQPDRHAVVHGGALLTYGQLHERAGRLAAHLRAHGVQRGTLVVLALERSPELVIAALAVLSAGGAYVGTDVSEPELRLAAIVADSGAPLVITHDTLLDRLDGVPATLLTIEKALAQQEPPLDGVRVDPADLCYVTYTSGSTGQPKGVLVEHGGLDNLVDWYLQAFQVRPPDRLTQVVRPSFDGWALEVWPCLAGGATLCIVEGRLPSSPAAFVQWLADERITVCFLPTALAAEVFDQPWSAGGAVLRALLVGGEKLNHRPPQGLPFQVYNLYGPTETTVVATWSPVEPRGAAGDPSIGTALPNLTTYVLDEQRRAVPPGTVGELYVGGAGVARGYLNRPELTAQRFVDDPFAADDPADPARGVPKMYATGDMVRQEPDGRLSYLTRTDGQVKLRGFRIELGEVEWALRQLDDVREAAVVKHQRGDRLVGYVVGAAGAPPPQPLAVRQALGRRLPDYMVPQTVVVLDALPLTPHGKVDRPGLAALDLPAAESPAPAGGLHTDTERVLAELWCDVLGISSVTCDDSFFDLGGDSLNAMRLAARARERGLRIGAEDLFESDMLHDLAAIVARRSSAPR